MFEALLFCDFQGGTKSSPRSPLFRNSTDDSRILAMQSLKRDWQKKFAYFFLLQMLPNSFAIYIQEYAIFIQEHFL